MEVQSFIQRIKSPRPRRIYTDGSFTFAAPLLDTLSLSSDDLTTTYGVAATGVYLPPDLDAEAAALVIRTPTHLATDAYYQELLGTTVSMLMSKYTPIVVFSDCSSAIKRTHQALCPLGPAVGHLQHGTLLLGLRYLASHPRCSSTLTWTPSHPERSKPSAAWTADDWGIHFADRLAGLDAPLPEAQIFHCDADAIHAAITPAGTWQWCVNDTPFNGSLRHRAQGYHYRQYTQKRDMKRIYANEPTRWLKYSAPLMAKLTNIRTTSPRQVGRRTKHLYDWMAHASNLAKGAPLTCVAPSQCNFCAVPETQQHINASCTHPPLVEARLIHRKRIDEYLQCYRHQHIHATARWIVPIIDYMEDHMWTDT